MSGIKFDQGKPEALYFYGYPFTILKLYHGPTVDNIGKPQLEEEVEVAYNFEELQKALLSMSTEEIIKQSATLYCSVLVLLHNIKLSDNSAIPQSEVEGVSIVSKLGAAKYGLFNYQKGLKSSQLINAIGRHFYLGYLQGEEVDPESGVSHLFHVLSGILMLTYNISHNPDTNDMKDFKQ